MKGLAQSALGLLFAGLAVPASAFLGTACQRLASRGRANSKRSFVSRAPSPSRGGALASTAVPAAPETTKDSSGLIVDPDLPGCSSIGMPRVHRYLKDDGFTWMMWFQGRDDEIDEEVVSLSTGRIFHATSEDGLSWTVSKGPGAKDSSFDVNTDEWWSFDTAHVGVGDVRLANSDKVLTAGGVYIMYYFGGAFESRPATDYMTMQKELPSIPEVTAMQLRIGVALSQDGIHWSRLEGEHATGAVVEVGKAGDFDELMVGWPQVVNHKDSEFRMYYQTMSPAPWGTQYSLGLARSEDGFKWRKVGPVDVPTEEWCSAGVSRRHVLQLKAVTIDEDSVAQNQYYMFYEGVNISGAHAIGLASSSDGLNWKSASAGPIFEAGVDGAWDGKAVGSPHVVQLDDGKLYMYYVGTSKEGRCAIGCAVGDRSDLTSWTRL